MQISLCQHSWLTEMNACEIACVPCRQNTSEQAKHDGTVGVEGTWSVVIWLDLSLQF